MGFREGEEEKSKQSSPMYLRGKSEVRSNRNIVNPPAIRLWRPLQLLPDIQNWVLLAEQWCFLWLNPAPLHQQLKSY